MKKNKVSLKPILYPNKILIAWKEAISGNEEIRNWLMKSKYKELGIFCFALNNDKSSRKWLFNNGYAHLLATGRPHKTAESFLLKRFEKGLLIDEKGQGNQPNLH